MCAYLWTKAQERSSIIINQYQHPRFPFTIREWFASSSTLQGCALAEAAMYK